MREEKSSRILLILSVQKLPGYVKQTKKKKKLQKTANARKGYGGCNPLTKRKGKWSTKERKSWDHNPSPKENISLQQT